VAISKRNQYKSESFHVVVDKADSVVHAMGHHFNANLACTNAERLGGWRDNGPPCSRLWVDHQEDPRPCEYPWLGKDWSK